MTRLLYISVGLRTRQDTISYSFDIYCSEIRASVYVSFTMYDLNMTKDPEYGNERHVWQRKTGIGQAYLSLTIGFSLSVRLPRRLPGRLRTLLSRRSFYATEFYAVRRLRSSNQRSRISMRLSADQSAIASCIDTNVQRATSD